jgi:hypothetical protein
MFYYNNIIMKLDCILTAVDDNPLYTEFIPIFIQAWTKLVPEADIIILYIGDFIPTEYEQYSKNIILIEPIDGISTAFMSQYIRLLYPAMLSYTGGVLITDMDMLPMSRSYYVDTIKDIPSDKWIYYRDVLMDDWKQIAMCYNIAIPSVWYELFPIKTMIDLNTHIKVRYAKIHNYNPTTLSGWCTDQEDVYRLIMEWNAKTGRFIYLKDVNTRFCRLDRSPTLSLATLSLGTLCNYTDYHAMRPYSWYKELNDNIMKLSPINNM